ncbi:hypothetical protein VI817_003392 [Penicillium citrinum]|nr:hypothetical protein VI817_003392 [Penicillium citrinum]
MGKLTKGVEHIQGSNKPGDIFEPSVVSASGSLSRQGIESCLKIMDDIGDFYERADLPTSITAKITISQKWYIDFSINFVPRSTESDPEMLGIIKLTLSVLLAYDKMICRPKNTSVVDVILDNPFLYLSKVAPNTYMSWAVLDGCVRADCEGKYPSLRTLRRNFKWSAAVVKRLQFPETHRIGFFAMKSSEEIFQMDGVEFRCRNCHHKIFVKEKWIIYPQAKLLIPIFQCGRIGNSEPGYSESLSGGERVCVILEDSFHELVV